MRKIFTFLMICAAMCMSAATTFDFSDSVDPQTADGFTVTLAKGGGQTAPAATTNYQTQEPEIRLYLGNTITVSGTTEMTSIQIVFAKTSASKGDYTDLSASIGTLVSGGTSTGTTDLKVDSWTGNATEVVFTLIAPGKQRQIKQLVINGDSVDIIDPEEQPLPTEDDLDWGYEYFEPETVNVPDTQIFHKEYAFIDGNILVHCDSGSIVKASYTEDAYFGVMEHQKITFTATQYIKGIAINGNVRKNFSASSDRGFISYLTDEDMEMAGDPVLVVRDINALSVTITCDKNLSCYGVSVYFEENPEPLDNEEIVRDTITLNYDTAQVVLDIDESEVGKYVYSLYIWDQTNEDIYLTLDINTPEENKFVGTYSIENGNMTTYSFFQYGEEYEDYSYATEGEMTISKAEGIYTITGFITCENYNTYNFSFSGLIEGGLDEKEQGLSNANANAKAVKVIRDGQLLIIRGEKKYNVLGTAL